MDTVKTRESSRFLKELKRDCRYENGMKICATPREWCEHNGVKSVQPDWYGIEDGRMVTPSLHQTHHTHCGVRVADWYGIEDGRMVIPSLHQTHHTHCGVRVADSRTPRKEMDWCMHSRLVSKRSDSADREGSRHRQMNEANPCGWSLTWWINISPKERYYEFPNTLWRRACDGEVLSTLF